MANIYAIKDFMMFECNASGTAYTKAWSADICAQLSALLDVDVVFAMDSTLETARIYPVKTVAGNGGGLSNYLKITKANQTLTFSVVGGSTSQEIGHQSATASGSKGPMLHYIKIGNYVGLGISTGPLMQMDVLLDLKNHIVVYNKYNSSQHTSVFTFVNSEGNAATLSAPSFSDSTAGVSLSPVLIPEFGLDFDDLFVATMMRASNKAQQYIINDESFFAGGNPDTTSEMSPQIVVCETTSQNGGAS